MIRRIASLAFVCSVIFAFHELSGQSLEGTYRIHSVNAPSPYWIVFDLFKFEIHMSEFRVHRIFGSPITTTIGAQSTASYVTAPWLDACYNHVTVTQTSELVDNVFRKLAMADVVCRTSEDPASPVLSSYTFPWTEYEVYSLNVSGRTTIQWMKHPFVRGSADAIVEFSKILPEDLPSDLPWEDGVPRERW